MKLVYCLIDKRDNDKVISAGSTTQTLKKRLAKHKTDSKRLETKFYKHMKVRGWEDIEMKALEEVKDEKNILEVKGKHQREHRATIYNTVFLLTEEQQQEIREGEERIRIENEKRWTVI